MASPERNFYTGSRALQWLSPILDLPIDQINFVACQLVGLAIAIFYRKVLHPTKVSVETRHTVAMVVGIILGYFCFGSQISHLVVQSTLAYIIMNTANPQVMQRVVMFVALLYLSSMHLLRLKYDYGGWTLDITGPLMIATQKVTSVAFSLHDGLARDPESLSSEQKRYAIRHRLTILEFFSYMFHFQSLMCGPLIFYNDYADYVQGRNYSRDISLPVSHYDLQGMEQPKDKLYEYTYKEPSPNRSVIRKLVVSIFFAVFLVVVVPRFPISRITTPEFLNETSYLSQVGYLLIATSVIRSKYYHAWLLGEAVCNAAGLGFSGYDSKGYSNWELTTNVDIMGFELSQNLRQTLETWNKSTQAWLKMVAYNRATSHKTLLTYVLSAIWHGFYPGYYLTFLGGAVFTMGGRTIRRCIRPRFQGNAAMAMFYNVLTCLCTRLIIMYIVIPFIMLELSLSLRIYWNFYFVGHLLCLAAIYLVPLILPPPVSAPRQSKNIQQQQLQNELKTP